MRSRDLDLENQSQGHLKVTKAKTLRKMQCCFPIASHARNSLACDMPLLVPYRIRYRLSVRAEKSKIKFGFLPLGGVKCKTQINFFRAFMVVVSQ